MSRLSLTIHKLCRLLLCLSGCAIFLSLDGLVAASPSFAAEKLVFRYGLFEESVPVADIRKYAETKKASTDLQFFLNFLNRKQQETFYGALQVKMPLNIVALDKLANTELGTIFLYGTSQAIARQDPGNVPALRAAIILGAKSPTGLGIVSFLEAYPSERIIIDLATATKLVQKADFDSSASGKPQDNLSSSPVWQLEVNYHNLATAGKQYHGCLFGDSVSAEIGNGLGETNYNYALNGLSAISLVEQLKLLAPAKVKCQTAIIAVGGNDAWYGISDAVFVAKLKEAIALTRAMGTKQIYLIPAFYSTVAVSKDPTVSAPLPKVEAINALIDQVAAAENIPVAAEGIQPLYDNHVLKDNLTSDGDHLNDEGIKIYRQALLNLLK